MPEGVDVVARAIAVAGVVISLAAIAVNYYLWHRSGPSISVTAFVQAERGQVHIEVANTGRMTAQVRAIELREYFRMSIGDRWTGPVSRWSVALTPLAGRKDVGHLPTDLAAGSYLAAEIEVREAIERASNAPVIQVQAWAQRGDGAWYRLSRYGLR